MIPGGMHRNDELAGRVELAPLPRTPGSSPDRVAVEGRLHVGRFRPGAKQGMQRRRFEFNAPTAISWPVLDEQVGAQWILVACWK